MLTKYLNNCNFKLINNFLSKQEKIIDWCTDFKMIFSSLSATECNFPKLHSWRYHAGEYLNFLIEIRKLLFLYLMFDLILVAAIRKYGALNGLSTETYEILHKYYVKNPYRLSNRKEVMQQLVNAVS